MSNEAYIASRPPHLVLLSAYGGPYAGSFIPMMRAIVREARIRGWSAEVVLCSSVRTFPWLVDLDNDGVPYRFAPDLPIAALIRWLSDNVLDSRAPTVLHTHFTTFDLPAALVARLRPNVPVFWHIHSNASSSLRVRIRNFIKYGFVGRFVEAILCVAPNIAEEARARGASRKRVVLVPNAIDTSRFLLTTVEERSAARRALGLPLESRIILHFGWDWPRKGGDTFVRTVGALTAGGTKVLGITVGGGEPAAKCIHAHGLVERVKILNPTDDVRTLYAAADLFMTPSVAEGMPFSMAEALCTGLAVVGSNIPGQILIGQNISACRLTSLDSEGLSKAARAMLSRDPLTIAAEGDAARAEIVRRLDLVPWAKRMVDRYCDSLGMQDRDSCAGSNRP